MEFTLDTLDELIKAGKVPEKDRGFATDLVTKGRLYASTPKQRHWVKVLIERASGSSSPKMVGGFAPLYLMFKRASVHLKHPKITLHTKTGDPVRLYVSGPRSRLPGMINVIDIRPDSGERVWYGRIDTEGQWTVNSGISNDAKIAEILALLKRLAKNPEQVASEYGKLTSSCCFCGRPLSDDRSASIGFGPICARNFGLEGQWKKSSVKDVLGG